MAHNAREICWSVSDVFLGLLLCFSRILPLDWWVKLSVYAHVALPVVLSLSLCASATFASKSRQEWMTRFAGRDACVTAVLSLDEVHKHPHNRDRRLVADSQHGHKVGVSGVCRCVMVFCVCYS
jgi:CoA-transferase family III